GLVDIDQAEGAGGGKRDDLACLLRHPRDDRAQAAGDGVVLCSRRHLEGGVTYRVALGERVSLDHAVRLERGEQPPGGAAVDAACERQLTGRSRGWASRDRLQQR